MDAIDEAAKLNLITSQNHRHTLNPAPQTPHPKPQTPLPNLKP